MKCCLTYSDRVLFARWSKAQQLLAEWVSVHARYTVFLPDRLTLRMSTVLTGADRPNSQLLVSSYQLSNATCLCKIAADVRHLSSSTYVPLEHRRVSAAGQPWLAGFCLGLLSVCILCVYMHVCCGMRQLDDPETVIL